MEIKSQKSYKIYLKKLLIFLLIFIVFIAIFNFLINPYNIFHLRSCYLNYLKPESKLQEHITKIIQLKFNKDKIYTVFLGSANVDNSIDTDYYSSLTGLNATNMAMGGLLLEDYADQLNLILKIHPEIRNVYLGINFTMFGGDSIYDEISKIKNKQTKNITSKDICYALLSYSTTRDSIWTIIKNICQIKSRMYTPSGTKAIYDNPNINSDIENSILENAERYKNFPYNHERLNSIRLLKDYCDNLGINLYIFIMPTHLLDLELMEKEQIYEDYFAWKSDLSEITPIYDFQYPSQITNEPISSNMQYFFDISHATSNTGNMVLDQMIKNNQKFGRLYTHDYAEFFNDSDKSELFMLQDDNPNQSDFLKVIRSDNNAV